MPYTKPIYKDNFENFINGEWNKPLSGKYFDNLSPVDGKILSRIADSNKNDVDNAIQSGSNAFKLFKDTSKIKKTLILNNIADLIEINIEKLTIIETLDNGKAVREILAADIPYLIDYFRYFAELISKKSTNVLNKNTIYEPVGVIAQIIPWNFPLLTAAWEIASAIASGNAIVIKPNINTPMSILVLMEIIQNVIPKGLVNIINSTDNNIDKYLINHKDISELRLHSEDIENNLIIEYSSKNIVRSSQKLGGKSQNIFFESIMDKNDDYLNKAIDALLLFTFNAGGVTTTPTRALIQESIYESFIKKVLQKIDEIKMEDPLDICTKMGAQYSIQQKEKILSYIKIAKEKGALCLIGGEEYKNSTYPDGNYIKPTILKVHNKIKLFEEKIFGPLLILSTFKDENEALALAYDTSYNLDSEVWSRNTQQLYKFSRGIELAKDLKS